MIKFDVTLTKLKLERLPAAVHQEVASEFRRIGADTAIDAQRRCPVDTGALRSSIHAEVESETEIAVWADMFYAAFVNYGTVHMAARPFMTQAVEIAEDQMEERLRAAVGRGLKRA